MLASCSFETYQCAAYGNHNLTTKHGSKAQSKYAKGKSSRNVVAAF